jgi:hypothetical protein
MYSKLGCAVDMVSKILYGQSLMVSRFHLVPGDDVPISAISVRIMRSFYWLTLIILVATYGGNLTASLAVEKVTMPFTTLQGLVDHQEYTLVISAGTVNEGLFKVSCVLLCLYTNQIILLVIPPRIIKLMPQLCA